MSSDAFGNLLMILAAALAITFFILFVFSLAWVYRDAEARGKTGCL